MKKEQVVVSGDEQATKCLYLCIEESEKEVFQAQLTETAKRGFRVIPGTYQVFTSPVGKSYSCLMDKTCG